ncbi:glyoxalase [Sphingopyxis terrae subsp. terrae NBRC 15098]|uniref:Glyoxalase n=1 Tax=Sphingopyxis terrae subsp. terrae NBRC 15098 TaxID=1219058 RepID=A0A142VVD1_9SPHN|nr:VOC family protein [Sphingopyxis terrae]AMU93773.1 glyoxalase [Sphingopyxis terrae subsp. terrae NBRC 15098]
MFSHVTLGANDIAATKRFYDAALGALGIPVGRVDERGRLIYAHDGGRLVITKPVNGEAAACGNGHTLGLLAASPEAVDAWHAAGLANGGTSAEDPPGIRNATEGRVLYLAYLRDPAGNKLCAFHKISD